jgi:chromosome segregation ATPase
MALETDQAQADPITPATAPGESAQAAVEVVGSPSSREKLQADKREAFKSFYDRQVVSDGLRTEEPPAVTAEVAAADATPTPEQAQAAQDEAAEIEAVREQMRPRLKNPVDIAIASIAKRDNISLAEATDVFRAEAAAKIPGMERTTASQPAATASQQIEASIATTNTEIEALQAEITAARGTDDYLTAEFDEKREKLSDLKLARAGLQGDLKFAKAQEDQSAKSQQQTADQAFEADRKARVETAYRTYPSLTDPKSLLCKNANAKLAEWTADPEMARIMRSPEAPEEIVKAAVHETALELSRLGKYPDYKSALASLKVASIAATPAVPQPKAAPVPVSAARRVTPAPGNKSQANGQSQPTSFAQAAAGLTKGQAKEANSLLRSFYDRQAAA